MTFIEHIKAGRPQFGLWTALASPLVAELCATTGFDWMLIDAEHGPNDVRTVLGQLQAVAPYDIAPVIRMPNKEPSLIKRYLDIGADTFLFPMVNSSAEAAALVAATRYPPEGVRGVGSGLGRVSKWNAISGYLSKANESVTVIVQIETKEALENLEQICQVPGVDAVFFGPADLAASFGLLGQPQHERVTQSIMQGIELASELQIASGVYSNEPEFIKRANAKGASFFGVASDTGLLASSARALAASFDDLLS